VTPCSWWHGPISHHENLISYLCIFFAYNGEKGRTREMTKGWTSKTDGKGILDNFCICNNLTWNPMRCLGLQTHYDNLCLPLGMAFHWCFLLPFSCCNTRIWQSVFVMGGWNERREGLSVFHYELHVVNSCTTSFPLYINFENGEDELCSQGHAFLIEKLSLEVYSMYLNASNMFL
jgi:hypothetical protein